MLVLVVLRRAARYATLAGVSRQTGLTSVPARIHLLRLVDGIMLILIASGIHIDALGGGPSAVALLILLVLHRRRRRRSLARFRWRFQTLQMPLDVLNRRKSKL